MDILAAYREVGSYRGAAEICGTTHKTVRRVVERHNAGAAAPGRRDRGHNYNEVRALVTERVRASHGKISAKRLLPAARAAGYEGSARNFRRLVAGVKAAWRAGHHRGRRPAVWTPGDTLVIDWGSEGRLRVFCAVLAWSRFRFVRFAADEKGATTMALIAECFEALGGVPKTVLADRMGCLKAGVVANVVVPTAEYVRFAAHYGFRPDFCEAADPESKGIVEHLVGYAKRDLVVPAEPDGSARPDKPRRAPRARTAAEKQFLAPGEPATAFLAGAAAAGVASLGREIGEILTLHAAHGQAALLAALERAVEFRRWRADDVRSILASAGAAPAPRPPGQALVLTLPSVPVRPLSDYAFGGEDQ